MVVVCTEREAFKMDMGMRRHAFRPLYTYKHFQKWFWSRNKLCKNIIGAKLCRRIKTLSGRARYFQYDLDLEIKNKPWEYRTM